MNNKSESDQEDNDDVNDNDWSYGSEKKGENKTSVNPCHNFFFFVALAEQAHLCLSYTHLFSLYS